MRFSAVDLPDANDLTVGIMALVAQQAREAISRRTREALAVARARGVKLGNPNGAALLRRAGKGARRSGPRSPATPSGRSRLASVVADIRLSGGTSLGTIAEALNARGMLTRGGGRWHKSTVMNLLDRLGLRAAMRQFRLMSLVEAVTNVLVGLLVGGRDADYRIPNPRSPGVARAEIKLALVFTGVSIAKLRAAAAYNGALTMSEPRGQAEAAGS